MLFNVTRATLPNGAPVLDYVYCDGAGMWSDDHPRPFEAGVSLARSKKLQYAKFAMFESVQRKLDARGMGQGLILNGMDTAETAKEFQATGVYGAM